jgi:hypothetical protein
MKTHFFIFGVLLFGNVLFGQCPPSGTVLSTQTEVNNFPATCTDFTGYLSIEDDNDNVDNM